MRYIFKSLGIACVLALAGTTCFAVGENDMPIVTDQPYTEEELQQIDEQNRDRLRRAQQILIDMDYMSGVADGINGPRTQSALKQFQADNRLDATGELNDATMIALEELTATLTEAKQVQQRLIDLGYLRGKADGVFGDRSRKALKLFQTVQGLENTGKLDDSTKAKLFSEDMLALPSQLNVGDKGEKVTALQEKLIQYGFLNGEADGGYGAQTSAAVKRFQRNLIEQGVYGELGIEESGIATSATLMILYSPEYSSYIKDIVPGEESDEVARIERRLADLGYMDAEADKVFDDYAQECARAFAIDADLSGDAFDKAFVDALFSVDAPNAERFVLHDIAYGDKGVAVREAQEAMVCGGMTISMPGSKYNKNTMESVGRVHDYLVSVNNPQASLFEDDSRLSVEAQQLLRDGLLEYSSDKQSEVNEEEMLRVQRRLHTLFYLSKHSIDGENNEATQQALTAFQEANELTVTGEADEATRKALFMEDAVGRMFPYRVEVDIDSQRVYVYQLNDDGKYEKIKTFICSTGLGDSTPRGIYLDGFPCNRWHHFSKYDCWAQYSFVIEGNVMFHSVLYSEKDEDTLREGSLYGLGSKASHGCVRLRVRDAGWLFVNCRRGSLVIIIY